MASSLNVAKYKGLIDKLFPQGFAFLTKESVYLKGLNQALANEPARLEERAFQFLSEMDPHFAYELLDHWEAILQIPDECTPEEIQTLAQRRTRVVQKLTMGGGPTPAFYKELIEHLGYNPDDIVISSFPSFRVGVSKVGHRLSNEAAGWSFTWQVSAPASLSQVFKVGQSSVGERLRVVENTTIECVIRKFSPAHTTVIFSYED